MQISRLHHPVRALGYGTRAGIWTQGCSIGCAGCISRDTWPTRPDAEVKVEEILCWLMDLPKGVDGVTVSGGEPTDQPDELRKLITALPEIAAMRAEQWDLLVYSGKATRVIERRFPWLIEGVDALVTGPFLLGQPSQDPLRGSANQEIITSSRLGQQRYGTTTAHGLRSFDVTVADGTIWMVGIPGRGDMESLREDLARRGIIIESPSWLA